MTMPEPPASEQKKLPLLRLLPLLIWVVCAILVCVLLHDPDADALLARVPENLPLAVLVMLGLFALKSVSLVFPINALFIASGVMFQALTAVVVSFLGMLITITIPFGIGRSSGTVLVERILARYPKVEKLRRMQHDNEIFFAYIVRAVHCLPSDAIALYLGSMGMTYWKYLLGGALGFLPSVIAVTLLGGSITDPSSPLFYVSVGAIVLLVAASLLLYRTFQKPTAEQA